MGWQFPFEKLEVWQLAKDFIKEVYDITGGFPEKEKFGLSLQIQRAVVSVASNLAEGTTRSSRREQAHFSQIAYGSLMETACQLLIAHELGYISAARLELMRKEVELIANKINALRKYQLAEGR